MEGTIFTVLNSQDRGDYWKAIVAENEKVGVILIQLHSSFFEQLDDEDNPTEITLTSDQAFQVKPLQGSFFNGLWIKENK